MHIKFESYSKKLIQSSFGMKYSDKGTFFIKKILLMYIKDLLLDQACKINIIFLLVLYYVRFYKLQLRFVSKNIKTYYEFLIAIHFLVFQQHFPDAISRKILPHYTYIILKKIVKKRKHKASRFRAFVVGTSGAL